MKQRHDQETNKRPIENEILEVALRKFQETTKLPCEMIEEKTNTENVTALRFNTPQINCRFHAIIKNKITAESLGAVLHNFQDVAGKKILVAPYINPRIAERLKDMSISFMDTEGNAYVNEPPIFIYIKGNPRTGKNGNTLQTMAFQTSGLKILFLLLCQPKFLNCTYREIAEKADVALGAVTLFFRDLAKLGYLIKTNKKNKVFIEKQKIIKRWAEIYPERIRQKLILGRYKTKDPNWWQYTDFHQWAAYWGGEVAAAKMTQYLKPGQHIIYLKKNELTKFVIQNGLIQDPDGNIEILAAFWNFEDQNTQYPHLKNDLAPPLLIYTDLLMTGNPRNMEVGGMIYEKYLT